MKMVVRLGISACLFTAFCAQASQSLNMMQANSLSSLEMTAKDVIANFNDLSKKISIPDVSKSIVAHDENSLKNALQDVMHLNRTITSQIDTAIGFWNLYLDSVTCPTKEAYLLGQVMASFLGTMRSLFLRSSVDQAMILSLIKKTFDQASQPSLMQALDVQAVTIEDRWKNLHL